MQKRVVLVSAAVAVLGLAAAALGFVAESTKSEASYAQHLHPPHLCSSNLISAAGSLFVPGSTSIHRSIGRARAGFCRLRRAALRVPAYAGARLRRRRGAARADGAGHRHRGQRMSPTRRARHRPQARRRRQAVHHRLGGGGGGGGDVPVRRGDEPWRDAGPLGEQGPALRPRLLLRLHRAQERHLRDGLRLVRRRHRVRHRGLRLLPADGRAGAGPVRRAGRRDGTAAVGAAVSSAALPAAYGLPCSSPVRARRLRPQATCGHGLSSMHRQFRSVELRGVTISRSWFPPFVLFFCPY